MSEEDRRRLAHAVTRRRRQLRRTQQDVARRAGLRTRRTVETVEAGRPVKILTLWKLDVGLDWPDGKCEEILTGTSPTGGLPDLTDPRQAAIWDLDLLTEDTRRAFIRLLLDEECQDEHDTPDVTGTG